MSNETEEVNPFEQGDVQVPALALHLLAKSMDNTAGTLTTLLESYRRDYARAMVELSIIRHRIDALLAGPYMANPDMIRRALIVYKDEVDKAAPFNYDYCNIMGEKQKHNTREEEWLGTSSEDTYSS